MLERISVASLRCVQGS